MTLFTYRRPLPTRVVRTSALVALLVASALSSATAQRARMTILADSVSLGERFEVAVAVDHTPGRSVVFPAVPPGDAEAAPLLSLGQAEAFSMRRLPPAARGTVRTDSAVYEVAVFAVDTARVGPIPIRLALGRDTLRVNSPSALVPVRSELRTDDATDPAPPGPPEPFPSAVILWVLLGLLGLAFLALLVWALRRVMRRPAVALPRAAPYPEALASLTALDEAPPVTAETVEEHVVEIRAVVRTYLGRRLGVPALEETTDELVQRLDGDARVSADARLAVLDVLRLTDLVAFAGFRPDPQATADVRTRARRTIETIEESVVAHEEMIRRAAQAATTNNPSDHVMSET